ncbi:MAG: hypothetical protein GY795_32655, partial [Desulfobacterales bacterium]|nr:hypothetical protein [Desulfobacterales bacterium]
MKTGIIFKKFFSVFTLVLLAMLSVSTNVSAADGDFDTSFSTDGLVTTDFGSGNSMGYSIAIQPDQKIVVAGEYNAFHLGHNNYFALARYTSNGSLDSTFGTDGKVTADFGGHDIGRSVAVQPDGKIVAAGYSETNGDFALVRYTSNGTLDDTFGSAGKVTTSYGNYEGCLSVAVQADGKIVAAGFSHNGSVQDFAVMRYNSDGSLDTGFDGDGIVTTPVGTGNDVGIGLLIQPDEKIVVTGISYNGTDNDFAVVRYNSDGSLDTSFGGDGTVTTPVGSGEDMGCFADVQSDGKIVLAGHSFNGSDDDFAMVRYNSDGSLDTGFGTGGKLTTPVGSGDDRSYGVCIQSDGKIVITGESYNGSNYDFAIARYNSDGSPDTTFGNGGIVTTDKENTDNSIHAAAVQSDGNIVTAGYSINAYAGWTKNFVVARYLSGNISPAGPDELKLTPDDGGINDKFGYSVSISGNYAIAGAQHANGLCGSAYIFKRDETGWNQQTELIPTGTDITNFNSLFGRSVCISGDYAVVSSHDNDNGSAYIFMKEGASWIQQAKLTANDGSVGGFFGGSVSISGNYAVIGSPYDDDNGDKSGSVYIFIKEGATWTQQAKLTPGTDAGYQSGCSVSISGDYVIVGAIGDNENGYYSGSAYIFKRDGTSWTQQAKLMPSDGHIQSRFGYSVSMSGDYAIVGTSKPNNRPGGFAYIFKRDGTVWNEQTKLTADEDISDMDFFASSVSISGDYAVVGNYEDHNRGVESGLAYVFKRDGTDWNKKVKLASSDGAEYDSFGHSVSISGNYAIIGAYGDNDNGSSSGSAYVYDLGP